MSDFFEISVILCVSFSLYIIERKTIKGIINNEKKTDKQNNFFYIEA